LSPCASRLASEDKRVLEAEAALKQAEGKVTKLEEALKQESDKVKRLEGLIASAPAGPSAELESELSDEVRRLLAEKVAMQVRGILVPKVGSRRARFLVCLGFRV
jgi:hypothetical protein